MADCQRVCTRLPPLYESRVIRPKRRSAQPFDSNSPLCGHFGVAMISAAS